MGGGGRTRWEQYVKSAEEAGEAGMALALGEEGGSPLSTAPHPDLARILGAGLRVFKLQKPLWLPLPHLPLQDGKPLLGVMNVTLCPRGS